MLNLSSEPDLAVLSQLARLEKLLLAAVAIVSGAILCMWYVPSLAIVPLGWSNMTALSAICLLLLTGEQKQYRKNLFASDATKSVSSRAAA